MTKEDDPMRAANLYLKGAITAEKDAKAEVHPKDKQFLLEKVERFLEKAVEKEAAVLAAR